MRPSGSAQATSNGTAPNCTLAVSTTAPRASRTTALNVTVSPTVACACCGVIAMVCANAPRGVASMTSSAVVVSRVMFFSSTRAFADDCDPVAARTHGNATDADALGGKVGGLAPFATIDGRPFIQFRAGRAEQRAARAPGMVLPVGQPLGDRCDRAGR